MSDQGDRIIESMREAIEWSKGKTKARVTQFFTCPECEEDVRQEGMKSKDETEMTTCPHCGWTGDQSP
jgi:predicted RNA-binding Zn-ribbon protein involved in translation (DUF1610 family)